MAAQYTKLYSTDASKGNDDSNKTNRVTMVTMLGRLCDNIKMMDQYKRNMLTIHLINLARPHKLVAWEIMTLPSHTTFEL